MKAIFYYPPVTPHTDFPTWEPLQLIFIVRILRENNIDAEIIDGRLFNAEEIKELIKQKINGTEICFGISSLTCYQIIDALNVARFVKEQHPDLPVIFGGWHATILPEETLKEGSVDIVIKGQGEATILEVTERLSKGFDLKGVKGISWKNGDNIIHEKERPLVSPDILPPLLPSDFEKLDLKHYQLNRVLFYMSSVGCPYDCKYCCIALACNKKWLPLSSEKVIKEIEGLYKRFGFKEVIFWDNVFFTAKKRVSEICRHIIDKKLNISWSAHARINEIITWDNSFIRLLKEGGCSSVFIGVESGSQQILDRINKRIKTEDIVPSFRKLKNNDINIAVNWMVDLPDEKYKDIRKTMKYIKEGMKLYNYDTDRFSIFLYKFVPFPGTPLFNELKREEIDNLPKSARGWGSYFYEKINDAMYPWEGENGPSLFASTTFYLWKAYLQREQPLTFLGKNLRIISKIRLNRGFFRFPVEWWMWKRCRKKKDS